MTQHFSLICPSTPWLNTSIWATFQEACDLAFRLSEQAFDDDVQRWGTSRPHPVNVMHHDQWSLAQTITFRG